MLVYASAGQNPRFLEDMKSLYYGFRPLPPNAKNTASLFFSSYCLKEDLYRFVERFYAKHRNTLKLTEFVENVCEAVEKYDQSCDRALRCESRMAKLEFMEAKKALEDALVKGSYLVGNREGALLSELVQIWFFRLRCSHELLMPHVNEAQVQFESQVRFHR